MITVLAVVLVCALLFAALYWLFSSPYSQVFGQFPYKAKVNEKIIAITFDDGPNEPYTSQLFRFLEEKNVKATFFQVGKCVERYPETTKKLFDAGHTIGIHSLSHDFTKNFTQPSFEDEITQGKQIIQTVIGREPTLFRPPWLWRSPMLFAQLRKMHLQPVSGEFCSSLEVFQPNATLIAKHALKKAKPGAILIFHDGFDAKGGRRDQTIAAAMIVIETLLKKGYRFVTVNELLDVPAYR